MSEFHLVMVTKKQAALDVSVVGGCSGVYVVASLLNVSIGWIIPVVVAVLLGYALLVLRGRRQSWRDYGLRVDNLAAAAWRVGVWTAVVAAGMVAWAVLQGRSLLRPELLIMLPFYPLWGLIQQLIFQGILHRGLLVIISSKTVALIVNSILFAAVHAPYWPIVGLTFVAGLCWSWFYQRWPNIWALGVSHGLLAGLAYPLLLGDNPLERFF